jgi:hypothetical protein
MQKTVTINDLFIDYKKGGMDRRQFEECLCENIIRNYKLYFPSNWKKDACIDYLCWLYPRISNAVDHYRNIGSSFDTYIRSQICLSIREFILKQKDLKADGYAVLLHKTQEKDEAVCSTEPEYCAEWEIPVRITNRRQVLILILKSYYFVSDDFLDRVAPLVGLEREKLRGMIDKLREIRLKRDDAIRRLRERYCCQFFHYVMYQEKLLSLTEDRIPSVREKLKDAEKRLLSIRKRLSRKRLGASNVEIAEVLGVPKGTIASNLHALKVAVEKGKRPRAERDDGAGESQLTAGPGSSAQPEAGALPYRDSPSRTTHR